MPGNNGTLTALPNLVMPLGLMFLVDRATLPEGVDRLDAIVESFGIGILGVDGGLRVGQISHPAGPHHVGRPAGVALACRRGMIREDLGSGVEREPHQEHDGQKR